MWQSTVRWCELRESIQALARCSIVNYDGHVLFDKIIKPKKRIVDFLTWINGITANQMEGSLSFEHYRDKIFKILKDAIIVGHSLRSDFEVSPEISKTY